MPDNVTFTVAADATPPGGTIAATDELSDGSHAGITKLAVSANGDRTLIPATVVDGMLVDVGALATAAQTQVADNAADVQLLAANALRKKWAVTNDSTAVLFVSYDGAASTTNYFVQVPPNSFFSDENWVGEVRGIWASDPNTGAARLLEIEA